MSPDFNVIVNDFIKPVVSLILFVFLILGWVTAFMLMKENTILRIKLGKEDEKIKESFRTWILRKSAPIVLPLFSFKTYLQEKQFNSVLKNLSKKKVLKLAFRFGVVASIVTNIFGIDTTRSS
jgi:hypothetical protein